MGIIITGGEGVKTIKIGNSLFTLDLIFTLYEEAFLRERALNAAGFSTHRTQSIDEDGSISKRGVPTILYAVWLKKGRVEKTRGRKPIRKGSYGAAKKRKTTRRKRTRV